MQSPSSGQTLKAPTKHQHEIEVPLTAVLEEAPGEEESSGPKRFGSRLPLLILGSTGIMPCRPGVCILRTVTSDVGESRAQERSKASLRCCKADATRLRKLTIASKATQVSRSFEPR
eukprot:s5603_g2.t1